jgi:hypothetical protein
MNKVVINGGLGNQMFQYALALALEQKGIKTRASFSTFLYEYHHNGFNLGKAFDLSLPFPLNALNFFLMHGEPLYKNRIGASGFRRIIECHHNARYTVYREPKGFIYDDNLLKQRNSMLMGTWQVQEYYKDVEKILKRNLFSESQRMQEIKRSLKK